MPVGVQIHNIELQKGKGGQLVRSAGTAARLVAKEGTYCHVELPSGELRLIHGECMATVGEVGNSEHNLVSIGKAGRARHMGKRPHVRGAVMNPSRSPTWWRRRKELSWKKITFKHLGENQHLVLKQEEERLLTNLS